MTDETDPPFGVLITIWFALFWRSWLWMLPVLLAAVLMAALVTIVGSALGIGDTSTLRIWTFIGYPVGFCGMAWAFMQAFCGILGRTFGRYRLVLERLPESG